MIRPEAVIAARDCFAIVATPPPGRGPVVIVVRAGMSD
jgi:hypothetical protein